MVAATPKELFQTRICLTAERADPFIFPPGDDHALIRPSDTRGLTRTDWLDSRHSFSFGDYRDPDNMGIEPARHQ